MGQEISRIWFVLHNLLSFFGLDNANIGNFMMLGQQKGTEKQKDIIVVIIVIIIIISSSNIVIVIVIVIDIVIVIIIIIITIIIIIIIIIIICIIIIINITIIIIPFSEDSTTVPDTCDIGASGDNLSNKIQETCASFTAVIRRCNVLSWIK